MINDKKRVSALFYFVKKHQTQKGQEQKKVVTYTIFCKKMVYVNELLKKTLLKGAEPPHSGGGGNAWYFVLKKR